MLNKKKLFTELFTKYTIHHQLPNTDTIHNKKVIMKCGQ